MPNCHWYFVKCKSTKLGGFALCFKIQTIHNSLTKGVISIKYYKPEEKGKNIILGCPTLSPHRNITSEIKEVLIYLTI